MKPPPIPSLRARVKVEPLAADRVQQIERAVVARAADAAPAPVRSERPWLAYALALGATAAAAGVVGWLAHGHGAPGGPGPGSGIAAAEPGSGAPIAVHTDAHASTIDIGDATIASSPATAFVVTRPAGGVLVALARGEIELDVGKRGDRPPLIVHAGDTDVVVVGTHFTVRYGGDAGEVDVRVREGRVRVVRAQHEQLVASGQEWSSASDAVIAVRPDVQVPAGSDGSGGSDGSDGADGSGGQIGEGSARTGSGVTIALGPTPNVLHDHVAAVPDPTPRPVVVRPPDDTVVTDSGDHTTSRGAKWLAADKADPNHVNAAIHQVAMKPALDVDARDAAAISEYLKLLNDKDHGSRAMYSIALVEHLRLGRNGDALEYVDRYQRRFTHGAEAADMLWLAVRIRCMDRARDATCKAAAQSYLDAAPDGPGAHVAELITLE